MKEYIIKKITEISPDWNIIPKADINIYKWRDNDYKPTAYAQLCHDEKNLYVRLTAFEKKIRAVNKELNGPVCEDSCLEFFFKVHNGADFVNLEMNPIGTMLIYVGPTREERRELKPDLSIFNIKTSVKNPEEYKEDSWQLEYKIPFSYMKNIFGEFDITNGFDGNFYKCGDETEFQHYGMWNEVFNETEEFHKPECFGRLIME